MDIKEARRIVEELWRSMRGRTISVRMAEALVEAYERGRKEAHECEPTDEKRE